MAHNDNPLAGTDTACAAPDAPPPPGQAVASGPAPSAGTGQRHPAALAGLAALTSALAACGGGDGGGAPAPGTPAPPMPGPAPAPAPAPIPAPPGPAPAPLPPPSPAPGPNPRPGPAPAPGAHPITPAEAARFLHQAQFSASDEEIKAVREQGYAAWLRAQMDAPLGQRGWDWLMDQGYNREDVVYHAHFADFMIWNQLIASRDAVRKRVALAWSEIMVVATQAIDDESPSFAMAAYWDVLNQHVFGNFRQLLEAVTLNPAMGAYLNTRGNQKEDPATGRVPDENYAREVMQLFTIGLHQLHRDGTPKRDGRGQPLETYGADDVTNLARVFTGYHWDRSGHVRAVNPLRVRKPLVLDESKHSTQDVNFLGTHIPGATPGREKLRLALDWLFRHPNVAPFIGKQLIQRLVTSNPSPAYVARVAAVFEDNGQGERGNLRDVTAAVLLDPEARQDPALAPPGWGKLREPVVRFIQWARTFNAVSTDNRWIIYELGDPATQLGQSPLRSPSVFNFFRPGYVPPGTALAASGQVAPEFQITNENSTAGYINFMMDVIGYGVWDRNPPTSKLVASYGTELALIDDPPALVARINLLMAAGQLSDATLRAITDAVAAIRIWGDYDRNARVWTAILLVMSCPEYLVQK